MPFFACQYQRDLSVLDELVHTDYVFRSPGQELQGVEALKAFFAGFRSAFPDLYLNIDDWLSRRHGCEQLHPDRHP